jgi:hypothetical protein
MVVRNDAPAIQPDAITLQIGKRFVNAGTPAIIHRGKGRGILSRVTCRKKVLELA